MAERITIEVFRRKIPDELTLALSEADSRTDVGSGTALTASVAAAYLLRAAALTAESGVTGERVDYIRRNAEILRGYLVKLIDEDVKCRGPLRRALKEGEARNIEAARQPAAAIGNEVISMMDHCLALLEELSSICPPEAVRFAAASADLSMGAIRATMHYVLDMADKCSDETYRYVVRRENELTLQRCAECRERILRQLNG